MPVIRVTEIADQRGGSKAVNDTSIIRERTRVFEAFTDNPNDGQVLVEQDGRIPQIGAPYFTDTEQDFLCVVKNIDARQQGRYGKKWTVRVTYDNRPTQAKPDDNPLNQPPKIDFGKVSREVPLTMDRQGKKPIKNKAGDIFDPPPMVQRSYGTFTITRNVANVNFLVMCKAFDCVNDDSFLGFDIKSLKIEDIRAPEQNSGGISYFQLSVTMVYNPEKWLPLKVLNAGLNKRDKNTNKLSALTDERTMAPVTKPRPLLADGTGECKPEEANYIDVPNAYDTITFGSLGLI